MTKLLEMKNRTMVARGQCGSHWRGGYDCKGFTWGIFFVITEQFCNFTVVVTQIYVYMGWNHRELHTHKWTLKKKKNCWNLNTDCSLPNCYTNANLLVLLLHCTYISCHTHLKRSQVKGLQDSMYYFCNFCVSIIISK